MTIPKAENIGSESYCGVDSDSENDIVSDNECDSDSKI